MKKFAKAVVLTLPQIFSVLILLVLHLYVFAMIGLLAFPRPLQSSPESNATNETNITEIFTGELEKDISLSYSDYAEKEGAAYFNSVSDAFMSLLVLLTTANHPDIMMPIYQFNRFSSIYFILFLGIGTFLILNLLIAATYSQFKGFFQKSLQSSFFRRRVAFRAAFTLLARRTYELQQRRGSRLSYVHEVVSKDLIRRLLQRAWIPNKRVPQMYTKLETISSHHLSWLQFRDVFDMVSKEPTRRALSRLPFYGKWPWFQWVQFAIRHRYFYYLTYAFSLMNVIMITVELQISYDNSLQRADSRLAYYNLGFVLYYSLEQALKLVGLGFRGYFRSYGNIYEGVLTFVLIIMEILVLTFYSDSSSVFHYDTVIRLMNIIIVFRLLRIVAHIKSLRILVNIIMDLFKNLSGFAGLMVIVYYLFALMGMLLFEDVDGASSKIDNDHMKWRDKCGTFDNLVYYANNFHDFGSSLIILWDIMVVNNWFIFLDKFARDSVLGGWSRLYFIAWWLTAAIIGMNLFVSLVLDTFLIKWDAVHSGRAEDDAILDSDIDRFTDSSNWEGASSSEETGVSLLK
jgi:two pore calcium channel protein 2